MSNIHKESARRFFQGWRRFQERYRVVSKSYSSHISLLELSILIETQIQRGRSRAELSRLFSVSPQSLSIAAQRLLDLGFLREVQEASDARRWNIHMTPAGVRELASIDQEANDILEQMSEQLTQKEMARLVRLLSRLEEHFPNERAVIRDVDHPLRGPIRTFTRGFGLLGRSAFGVNGVSTFDWHLLSAIHQNARSLVLVDLCDRFQCKRNSLSMLLSRMEVKGQIRKLSPGDGDGRRRPLQLGAAGEKLLRQIEEQGEDLLSAAMKDLTAAEGEELCKLFDRLVGFQELEYEVKVALKIRPLEREGSRLGVFLGTVLLREVESRDEKWNEESILELFR